MKLEELLLRTNLRTQYMNESGSFLLSAKELFETLNIEFLTI